MELTAEELIRDLGLDPVKNAETRFASCFSTRTDIVPDLLWFSQLL